MTVFISLVLYEMMKKMEKFDAFSYSVGLVTANTLLIINFDGDPANVEFVIHFQEQVAALYSGFKAVHVKRGYCAVN